MPSPAFWIYVRRSGCFCNGYEIPNTCLGVAALHESTVTDSVTGIIESDRPCYAFIGDRRNNRKNFFRIDRAGCLECFECKEICIITHNRYGCELIVAAVVSEVDRVPGNPCLDAGIKVSIRTFLIEGSHVNAQIGTLSSLQDDVGVPCVTGEDRHTESLCVCLCDNLGCSFGRYRAEEDVATLILSIGDVSGEVLCSFGELLIDTVILAECRNEVVAKAAGVVIALLGDTPREYGMVIPGS